MRRLAGLLLVLALAACGDRERREQRVPMADPGLRVWAAQGCGSCHAFAPAGATATIGPNLGHTLAGRTKDYIRESIVAPDAVNGPSIMPQDYARRISKPQLDALVAFIARGARAR